MIIVDVNWLFSEIGKTEDEPVEPAQDIEPTDDKRKLEDASEDDKIREIRKVREEAKEKRIENASLKKKIVDMEQAEIERKKQEEIAKLSELEKEKSLREEALSAKAEAEKRAEDATNFLQTILRDLTVEKVAEELGFRNPKLAIKLYGDMKDIEITDGEVVDVENVKDRLNKMLDEYNYLRKTADTLIVKSPDQPKEPVKIINPASKNGEKEELKRLQKEAMVRGEGAKALSYYLKANSLLPK